MKGVLKKWVSTENQCEVFRQKISKTPILPRKTKQKNLKKAFRIKLFELCKTTSKKSSPDLFNFYVISAGHDMAIDAARATTCRRNFKAPRLQTERTKNEGPFKKVSFNGKSVWRFQTKNFKNSTPPTEIKTKKPEKSIQNKNCSNSARLHLRSQVLTCSTFM